MAGKLAIIHEDAGIYSRTEECSGLAMVAMVIYQNEGSLAAERKIQETHMKYCKYLSHLGTAYTWW